MKKSTPIAKTRAKCKTEGKREQKEKKRTKKKEKAAERKYDIGFKSTNGNGWGFLSNFWPDVKDIEKGIGPKAGQKAYLFVDDDGKKWHSSEHYFQWHMYHKHSPALAKAIYAAPTALAVKKLSSQKGYAAFMERLHPEVERKAAHYKREFKAWKQEEKKEAINIMKRALAYKFSDQNPEFTHKLLSTGNLHISEQGRTKKDFWAHTGSDMLGKLIMERRAQLARAEEKGTTVKRKKRKRAGRIVIDDE